MPRMPFDFHGYRAIVAGGSRGIGRSIALGFAEAGAAMSIGAHAALFPASPWAGWITGHTLVVDGGQMLHG